ncbi:myosin-9-like isoform X2 [Lytechinus variegatus]|uniref:myosin-9-like isoform X2 n=1 Tax=Lytechinus variegatus TaxID=7654 RepID=UPI001BB12545|nr:myosin-9-like isoform X2 [Lytechinus variegatus]
MDAMNKELLKNGVSQNASPEEKLRVLWKLYTQAEADIKAGSQSMQLLQKKQAEEMKEVELYVENIRKLSEEREALTQEFEAENEELKEENQRLKKSKEKTNQEIKQLLKQEGFEDLAQRSPSEALAYFLVERTRLSDNIATERRKSLTNESAKNHLDQVQRDKIGKLEKEKVHLEQENRQQIQRVKELELELKMIKNRLEKEKETHHKEVEKVQKKADERLQSSSGEESQLREAKRKLEQGLTTMKYRLKTSEEEKEKITKEVKELTESLDVERKRRSSYEGTIIKLKHLLDTNRKTISTIEEEKETLNVEKKSLEQKFELLKKDVQEFKAQEKQTVTKPEPSTAGDLNSIKLQEEIKRLQKQNETCVTRLEDTMISLESEKMKCRELERKLSTTEEKWELVVKRYRDNEKQLNSKLDLLSHELDGSKTMLSNSQLDILKLQAENKRILNTSSSEREKFEEQLKVEQSFLGKEVERHRETIGDLERLVEGLKKDRDVLAHELQAMISKEQKHKEWLGSVDLLEKQNRELSDKKQVTFLSPRFKSSSSPSLPSLESSLSKETFLQQELEIEKRKNQDLASRLKMSEHSGDVLQEELGRRSAELFKQYDTSRDGQNKLEIELLATRRELEMEKALAAKDKANLNQTLEREELRLKDLETSLSNKNQEITQLKREVGRLSLDGSRAGEKVSEEARRRSDIESRNKVLEEEMTKLWGQMKGMVDRLAEAEKSKHELEAELTRLTNQYRHQEAAKDMHHAETVAVTTTLSKVQQRAQAAEKKIPELQTELDQTSLRLQATEVQLKDYGALRVELQDRRDEIVRLKSQLQDDKLQRSVMAQQIDDLRQQGKASREIEDRLRKENQELKDELLAIQTKLHYAEDTSRSVSDKHNLSEQSRSSLLQQVGNLQAERDNLSQELTRISNQLDAQIRKYQDYKNNTKIKMQQARDLFAKQKGMLGDSLMKLQEELNAARSELQKTNQSQSTIDNKHQTLLAEHREHLTKFTELEEMVRDQSREIGTQDYRIKFLERENAMLQERIDTLSKQRMALEKLVREYRLEKQKDEINRSIGGLPSYGSFSQPSSHVMLSPSSGMGNSVSNVSSVDLVNGHPDGLLVKTNLANGSGVH